MFTMLSDKALAKRATHNPEAFAIIFDRYAIKVYRYIYSRVQHHESAEDITSQVFLATLENIQDYKPFGSFEAWIFTIARRRIADFYRKENPTEMLSDDIPPRESEILASVIQKESVSEFENQFHVLQEDEKELLRLRFAAGMRFKDIATLLGKKPDAVKIATYRLIDRLKKNMEIPNG